MLPFNGKFLIIFSWKLKKKALNFEKEPSFLLRLKKKRSSKPPSPPSIVLHFIFLMPPCTPPFFLEAQEIICLKKTHPTPSLCTKLCFWYTHDLSLYFVFLSDFNTRLNINCRKMTKIWSKMNDEILKISVYDISVL